MKISFQAEYDVIVIGGGIAGVAAAIAAAENGAKTALIEKTAWFGGLATTGLIYFYLPICDGCGHQVSFGLSEKLLKASFKYGPDSLNLNWQQPDSAGKGIYDRYRTTFSPASFIIAMDELLEQAGVEIWLDTVFTGFERRDNINMLYLRNKGGNGLFKAPVIIDATGDGEVVREAGGTVRAGENQLAYWGLEHCNPNPAEENWYTLESTTRGLIKGLVETTPFDFHENDPRGVTEFLLRGRKWAREQYAGTDHRKHFPVLLPGMAQFRTAAAICGLETIAENTHNTRFEDSIGMSSDWGSINTIQEIPYKALIPRNTQGIIAAGRCISAEGYAWELIRSIPACAVSGEAAGTAAALCVKQKTDPQNLSVPELQQVLRQRGCKLNLHEAGLLYRDEPGARPSSLKKTFH
ncbi:MAG: FAD-dependent oxidoreductase [Lentisphaeria bacterium]|nr:FAD-dependent oxidoreductase [Lentisphaeria bacterium]